MSNNLKLGCDCLGSIHYLDGVISDSKGGPVKMENVVCVHEIDSGIIHKHVNYRTGRGVVARNRELVLQNIITVANYDYILAFIFNQAGEITYEVRATGILSTSPVDDGVEVPWGTVVHPGVLGVHHQHIFSLRVDPALDGYGANRLTCQEAHALPRDPDLNRHGIGYGVRERLIEESGGYDLDPDRHRTYTIQNGAVANAVNGQPVGYRIQLPPFQKMLADRDSFHHRRAEFADRSLYVTRYRDDELFAGGKYTNQSRGGTGVRAWADRRESVKDADLVLWLQFGINHIPRVEDFPVRRGTCHARVSLYSCLSLPSPLSRLYLFPLSYIFSSSVPSPFFNRISSFSVPSPLLRLYLPFQFPLLFLNHISSLIIPCHPNKSILPLAVIPTVKIACSQGLTPRIQIDHAGRDHPRLVEAVQLLRQEPGPRRAALRTDL